MPRPGARKSGKALPSPGFRASGLLDERFRLVAAMRGEQAPAARIGQMFTRLLHDSSVLVATGRPDDDVRALIDTRLDELTTHLQAIAQAAIDDALEHQEEIDMTAHEQVLDVMRTDPAAIWNASKVSALLNADPRTISGRMRRLAGEDRIERCETPGEYRLRTQAPPTSPAAEPSSAACSSTDEAAPEEIQDVPEVPSPAVEEEHAASLPDPVPAAPEHAAPLPDSEPAAPEHVAVPEAAPPAPAAPVRRARSQKVAPAPPPVLVPTRAPVPVILSEGVPPARPVTVTELEVEQLVGMLRALGRPASESMIVSRLSRSGWRMANVSAALTVAIQQRLVTRNERSLYEVSR